MRTYRYLDTVAEMMSKKPELELQACPVAGPQEVEAWVMPGTARQ